MDEVRYRLDRKANIGTFEFETPGNTNNITERFVSQFRQATENAIQDGVSGVIIASLKKGSFLHGFKLSEIGKRSSSSNIKYLILSLHDSLDALAKAPFPAVAVLRSQAALAEGFETILWACDHIFATGDSKFGLTQTNTGLFPIAGGLQTLSRIVGFRLALNLTMSGKPQGAEIFKDSPAITFTSEPNLFSEVLVWIEGNQGILNRNYDTRWNEPDIIGKNEKLELIKNAQDCFTFFSEKPHLAAALNVIKESIDLIFEEAVKRGVDDFIALTKNRNTRNKIDLLSSLDSQGSRLVRIDNKQAKPVASIAIFGCGEKGRQVARIFADTGIKVYVYDKDESAARKAKQNVEAEVNQLIERGEWTPKRKIRTLENIIPTDDYSELSHVPLVVEAVDENLNIKQELLKHVQSVRAETLFVSTTSTITLEKLTEHSRSPEYVVGMHYSPVNDLPLLEVVSNSKTSDVAIATVVSLGRRQGRLCISVGDKPCFYVSRLLAAFISCGFFLLDMGLDPFEIDQIALEGGFREGPFRCFDLIGGASVYTAISSLQKYMPQVFSASGSLKSLVKAIQSETSIPLFYTENLEPNRRLPELMGKGKKRVDIARERIRELLMHVTVNQAFLCMDDGVLRDYYSMDFGATLGMGFPENWHGPARYVSQQGVRRVRASLDSIYGDFSIGLFKPAVEFSRLVAFGVDTGLI